MAVSHRNFSFLVCRTLLRRGGRRNFPLSRSLCGSSVRYGLQDEVESHNEGGEMLPHGLKGKESRYRRVAQLRKNRHDTDLEKKARTGQLLIPLSSVQLEWRHHRGLQHLHTVGIHNRLFSDIFKTEFRPKAFISVTYGGDSDDSAIDVVHHGNLLTPAQASAPPKVQLPQELKKTEGYATLMLTNPDGHLRDSSLELLHWMITNIHTSSLELSSGSELMPYLQPLPLRGTGFHRFVFSLFIHHDPLDITHSQFDVMVYPVAAEGEEEEKEEGVGGAKGGRGTWLNHRTFSTSGFILRYPQVEPFSFALFQSQWDESVQHMYSSVLGYPEPVYALEKKPTPRQTKRAEIRRKRANLYRNM